MLNCQVSTPSTSTNSMIVGISVSTARRESSSMPERPRSSTRVRPPVLRSRWKRSERRCMCSKVLQREPPHGVHGHLGEEPVAHLRQERHGDAGEAVEDREQDRRAPQPALALDGRASR